MTDGAWWAASAGGEMKEGIAVAYQHSTPRRGKAGRLGIARLPKALQNDDVHGVAGDMTWQHGSRDGFLT